MSKEIVPYNHYNPVFTSFSSPIYYLYVDIGMLDDPSFTVYCQQIISDTIIKYTQINNNARKLKEILDNYEEK